jgi:hypothetical protein
MMRRQASSGLGPSKLLSLSWQRALALLGEFLGDSGVALRLGGFWRGAARTQRVLEVSGIPWGSGVALWLRAGEGLSVPQ